MAKTKKPTTKTKPPAPKKAGRVVVMDHDDYPFEDEDEEEEKPKAVEYTSKVIKHEKLFYDAIKEGAFFSTACKRTGNNAQTLTAHFATKTGKKEWANVEEAANNTFMVKDPRVMRLWESHCKRSEVDLGKFVEAFILSRNALEVATMLGMHYLEYIQYVRQNDTVIMNELSNYRVIANLFE